MEVKATKLSMVILMQQNIEEGILFYECLGCTLHFSIPDQWAELKLGDLAIGLCPAQVPPEAKKTGLVFAVPDINAFYELHKNHIRFLCAPITKTHGIMTSIQDHSGNIIDLYQATPEKIQAILGEQCCRSTKKEKMTCCKNKE